MSFPLLRSPARAVATSLVLLAGASPPALGAQAPDSTARSTERRPRGASPFLSADHWAVAAARRLYAAGLVGREFGTGERTPTVRDVALAFTDAAAADSAGATGAHRALGRLAAGYLGRLREEYAPVLARLGLGAIGGAPAYRQPLERAAGIPVAGRFGVGGVRSDGLLRPGGGLLTVYESGGGQIPSDSFYPPTWGSDTGGVALQGAIVASPARQLALSVTAGRSDAGIRVTELQAVGAWRRVGVWAGRRAPGYGVGSEGAVAVSGGATFDGAGVFLAEPYTLPGFLRWLGPWRLELYGSRVDSSASVRHPLFFGGRASIAPFRVLQLGMNRGAMLGGEGNLPVTVGRLAGSLFLGFKRGESEFENQVLSFDARLTPTVAGVPLDAYLEWGMDDAAGAVRSVPGIVAGLGLPAVPGAPWLSLGVERATFAQSCCFNPPWGRHAVFQGGWTNDARLIGHPLGGEGRQTSLVAHADLLDARLRLGATAFHRTRGTENLLAPTRHGGSDGGTMRLEWRVTPTLELATFWNADVGRNAVTGERWRDGTASGSVRMLF